jgi:hypothetical protein
MPSDERTAAREHEKEPQSEPQEKWIIALPIIIGCPDQRVFNSQWYRFILALRQWQIKHGGLVYEFHHSPSSIQGHDRPFIIDDRAPCIVAVRSDTDLGRVKIHESANRVSLEVELDQRSRLIPIRNNGLSSHELQTGNRLRI